MARSRKSWGAAALRLLVAGSLAVSGPLGCANGGNVFSSTADASDPCGQQHVAFADSKNFYLQEVAQGAVLGALGGAALGAITAATTGGNVGTGAAIGAGTGLVAGGTAGYFNARAKQNADHAQLANSIYGDITKASSEMDRATTTFGNLRACRFSDSARIKGAVRSGTMPREQGVKLLADHKRRFDDELALARQYGTKMAEQDDQFRFASDNLVKDDPEAQRIVATRRAQYGVVPAVAVSGVSMAATTAVNVRAAPDGTAARVGSLAKGEPVKLGSEPPANG